MIFPSQALGEALQGGGKNGFEETLKKHEGKVISRSELGKRFLGYSVKKTREGYVVSFVFELPPAKMSEFKRSLQLAEDILKFTITIKPKISLARASLKPVSAAHTVQAGEKSKGYSHGSEFK